MGKGTLARRHETGQIGLFSGIIQVIIISIVIVAIVEEKLGAVVSFVVGEVGWPD